MQPRHVLTATAALLMIFASGAVAVTVDTRVEAFEESYECWEHEEQHERSYEWNDSYHHSAYSTWQASCRGEYTLAGASADAGGQTLAGARLGSDSGWSSSSDSRYEHGGYRYPCHEGAEYNDCGSGYSDYRHRHEGHGRSSSGVYAETLVTGPAAVEFHRCSDSTTYTSDHRSHWWYGNGEHGSYEDDRRTEDASYGCFFGAANENEVSGTGTALDGARAHGKAGHESHASRTCDGTWEEPGCVEEQDQGFVAGFGFTVPGVGTFSSRQKYSPEPVSVLP